MKAPLPPPPQPSSDDEDAHGNAAAEAQISLAWQDALEWAKRGDLEPLTALLRSENSLQDDRHVRDFLADVLEGKFKRPRGKPVSRPEMTWWLDPNGQIQFVDRRDVRWLKIKKWVRDNKPVHGEKIFEAAATHFGMEVEAVHETVRRSSKAWKRSRST